MHDPADPPVAMGVLGSALGLPPDLDVVGHPGAGRSAWRLVSPSTGDEWHLRAAGPNGAVGFQAGRELTRRAIQAGLGVAIPLAVPGADDGEPSIDRSSLVIRSWLDGTAAPGDSAAGEWLGDLLPRMHRVWPLSRTDDDAIARWYGVFPRTRWEQWFNQAEDAALPWTALSPPAMPVIAEATSLVKAGLAIRGMSTVMTHRLVEPRHIIAGIDGFTLIDPFAAGPDLAWLEVVDVAAMFPGPVIETYVRSGGTNGPSIVEATCRRYGRELHDLALEMSESLASPEDDEVVEIAFASIQARIDLLTDMVERIESRANTVFG